MDWNSISCHEVSLNKGVSESTECLKKEVKELKYQLQASRSNREEVGLWKFCLTAILALMVFAEYNAMNRILEQQETLHIVEKERDGMIADMKKAFNETFELKQEREARRNFEETRRNAEIKRYDMKTKMEKTFNQISELKQKREELSKKIEETRRITEKERDDMKAEMKKVSDDNFELKQEREEMSKKSEETRRITEKERDDMKAEMEKVSDENSELKQEREEMSKKSEFAKEASNLNDTRC